MPSLTIQNNRAQQPEIQERYYKVKKGTYFHAAQQTIFNVEVQQSFYQVLSVVIYID